MRNDPQEHPKEQQKPNYIQDTAQRGSVEDYLDMILHCTKMIKKIADGTRRRE